MSHAQSWKSKLKIYGPALLLIGGAFLLALQFVEPAPPDHMTIVGGAEGGAYYALAHQYKEKLEAAGIDVTVLATNGSMDNLERLSAAGSNTIVGFAQSGLAGGQDDLMALGSLYFEPLWVFHRKDLPLNDLRDVSGLRAVLGSEGSGTRRLAETLLGANNVTVRTIELRGEPPIEALHNKSADTVFLIGSAGSSAIQTLLSDPDIALLSFDRAEAYRRYYPYLSHMILPEGAIDLVRNIPNRDIQLIAPVAMLVVREDIHPALIDLLLIAAKGIHAGPGLFEETGDFPSPEFVDFPLSEDARRFYERGPSFLQRYLPFWAATLIDRWLVMLLPLLTLALPLLRIMPPVYTWRIRSRIYRWYDSLREIEANIRPENREDVLAELDRIEDDVSRVEVPLSYMDELYNLRLHIRFLKRKLTNR